MSRIIEKNTAPALIHETEQELIELKEFNESIINSISESLLVIDPKTYVILTANAEAINRIGLPVSEIVGKTCYQVTHKSSTPCLAPNECPLSNLLKDGSPSTVEHVHYDNQNREFNEEITVSPIKDNKGNMFRVIHLSKDITEAKRWQTALSNSEAKYRALVENANDGILLTDMEGNTLYRNPAYFKQLGLPNEDTATSAKIHPEDLPIVKKRMKELIKNGFSSVEYRVKQSNGPWVYHYARSTIINNEKQEPSAILSVIRDTTAEKRAEEALKQAEEKHRTLLNSANVMIQSVDAYGKFVFVNDEWKRILGYTDEEAKDMTVVKVIRADHIEACMNIFTNVMKGLSINNIETIFVKKDGGELIVSGNVCPIFKDDKFVSTVGFFVDITKRKETEQELVESNRKITIMNEKLRVIGSLTRHDVRNKLSAIMAYTYLLKKKHKDLSDVIESLEKMEQAVAESTKIFDFAKLYEQLGVEGLTYVNVESKLNEAKSLFSGSMPNVINQCHGLELLADSFLRQLFYNFIEDTQKYGQKTTTIRVHFERKNQDALKLIYEDDGVGVPIENKRLLFREGFSTGGSTGYGLFLIKKMIEVYGWEIEEKGESGKGAKFIITIPKLNSQGKKNFIIKH